MNYSNLSSNSLGDDGHTTRTSIDQLIVEEKITGFLREYHNKYDNETDQHNQHHKTIYDTGKKCFLVDAHVSYLYRSVELLPSGYSHLDASRPWLCYWILHSLRILNVSIPEPLAHRCVSFLSKCQSSSGGFGGGPDQYSHLAPTFAAVNALCIIANAHPQMRNCLSIINRQGLYRFLVRMHQPPGFFTVCDDGEYDTRATYCALVVAKITNLLSSSLIEGTGEWLLSCQTYEGGIGGEEGNEAHGGYTYCALSSLILLEDNELLSRLNLATLSHWLTNRQMRVEGGCQGRTNKLVDGCYSFWVQGCQQLCNIVKLSLSLSSSQSSLSLFDPSNWCEENSPLFNSSLILLFVLSSCQTPTGGLRDKPGKPSDIYHTCYCLSGLSIAYQHIKHQHIQKLSVNKKNEKEVQSQREEEEGEEEIVIERQRGGIEEGEEKHRGGSIDPNISIIDNNNVSSISLPVRIGIHPLFNLFTEDVESAYNYFNTRNK